jgi:hypothetical protein
MVRKRGLRFCELFDNRQTVGWVRFAVSFRAAPRRQAAFRPGTRIQQAMNRDTFAQHRGPRLRFVRAALFGAAILLGGQCAVAQESSQAPLSPPAEHDVRRMGNTPEPPAPPSLPPDEIIKRFSQKEDEYLAARPVYGYRKTIRIDEFDREGKLVGQFQMATETVRGNNGQVFSKVVERPQSTLHFFTLESEDVKELDRVPLFPLTTSQLVKYDLKYIGEELVDELQCYIFQVKPRGVDRTHAYFEGIVWVDAKYLEVVKTYGKWVNELGDVHILNLPFTTYETYRENVDGKYWFPNYERSDDTLHLKDTDVAVRLVIKWTDFKPLPAAAPAAAPAPAPAESPAPAKPQS